MVQIFSPSFLFSICSLCFTEVQKALVKHWREQGICIFTYLDNGQEQLPYWQQLKCHLREFRGHAHPEKCSWESTQKGELLGFSLNVKGGVIYVQQQRTERLKEKKKLINKFPNHTVTARQLACVVGTMVSMILYLVSPLWTRPMYHDILCADCWSNKFRFLLRLCKKCTSGSRVSKIAIVSLFWNLTPRSMFYNKAILKRAFSLANTLDPIACRLHTHVRLFNCTFSRLKKDTRRRTKKTRNCSVSTSHSELSL